MTTQLLITIQCEGTNASIIGVGMGDENSCKRERIILAVIGDFLSGLAAVMGDPKEYKKAITSFAFLAAMAEANGVAMRDILTSVYLTAKWSRETLGDELLKRIPYTGDAELQADAYGEVYERMVKHFAERDKTRKAG